MASLGAGLSDNPDRTDQQHLRAIAPMRTRGRYERYLKRPFDVLVACVLLLLFLPLMLMLAIAVRLRMGAGVIYRQKRVGHDGRQFIMYKFRTMIADRRVGVGGYDGADRRGTHKTMNDPRVVPVGRALRKLSLDELPQLWNVVNGDMSLVGPRPELPLIVDSYQPWQHERHAVKPGITGLWQISRRDELLKNCTETDIEYIRSIGFLTDVKVLLITPFAALGRPRGF